MKLGPLSPLFSWVLPLIILPLSGHAAEALYDGMKLPDYCAKLLKKGKRDLTGSDLYYCDDYYKRGLIDVEDFDPTIAPSRRGRERRDEVDIPIADDILEEEIIRTPVKTKDDRVKDPGPAEDLENLGEDFIEAESAGESMEIEEAVTGVEGGGKGTRGNTNDMEVYEDIQFKGVKELPVEEAPKRGKGGAEKKSRGGIEVDLSEVPASGVGLFDSTIIPLEGRTEFIPLEDNYELVILSVDVRGIVYELPLLLPGEGAIEEPFWVEAEVFLNGDFITRSRHLVTPSGVSRKGSHLFLKFQSPWNPLEDATLKISVYREKEGGGQDRRLLFTREKRVKALKRR